MVFGKEKAGEKTPEEKGVAHAGGEDIRSDDPKRVKTGIPRLDYILKGGLIRSGTYLLFGPPGCGKTIMSNQLAFNHVQLRKERVLVVTLLTESHGALMEHLRTLSFFREDLVSSGEITYVSGFRVLEKEGLKGLLEMIRVTLHERQATMLVLDGLEGATEVVDNEREVKKFLHELMAVTRMYSCTSVLCSAARPGQSHPENTVVDGVFEIILSMRGPRAMREFAVHKFRGTDFLPGKHETEITEKGLQVHPRTEIQFDKPPGEVTEKRIRMGFGVERIDQMLRGGPFSGAAAAIVGAPGVGKTMLGLSFLVEGARQGQCGIHFGFYEPPPRLIEKAEAIGIPLGRYVKNGMIEILWQPPLEHYLDSLAEQLLEKLRSQQMENRQKRRLFIDGIEGFRAAAAYPERMPRFLSAFINQLRMLDITTLFSDGIGLFRPEMEVPNDSLVYIVESVIALRMVEIDSQLKRLISIMKMQESDYDRSIRQFDVTSRGFEIGEPFGGTEALLSGRGHRELE